MIVAYFRSSSYNCWSFCPMQWYLTYCLNMKPGEPGELLDNGSVATDNGLVIPKPQWKADQGNIVHKALELLARKKLASQRGEVEFREDEMQKSWPTADFGVEEAFAEAWGFYTKVRAAHWPWDHRDYKRLRGWYLDTLEFGGGRFNPLNRKVIQPEQYFDITIDRPWAKYAYTLPDGSKLDGQLAIKGTMDLVTEVDSDTLEYADWKTGQRKDWATGKKKDWKKLRDDPQMRMYHYALTKLHPQYKYIIMTVVWSQDGGPFPLDFGPADLPKTEKMLRERFETIRGCERPPRILNDRKNNAGQFKCKKLCTFGMSKQPGTDDTVCDHMHKEIVTLGLTRVTAKYMRGKVGEYGSGGGVENRDAIENKSRA